MEGDGKSGCFSESFHSSSKGKWVDLFWFFIFVYLFWGQEGSDGDCRGVFVTKPHIILAVQKSCFRIQTADDPWCCWQICFQLAATSPEREFQPKAYCRGGTARSFCLLRVKELVLPGSTSEKKRWKRCERERWHCHWLVICCSFILKSPWWVYVRS